MRRSELVGVVAKAVGEDVLAIRDARDGWPASAEVRTDAGTVNVALHVGPIGLSQRGRDDVERRFQNPGAKRPVAASPGEAPILLGVWIDGQSVVFVALDGRSRLGRTTRFSLFVPVHLLRAAAVQGWAEHFSSSDEKLTAFHPSLLPLFVSLLRDDVSVDADEVRVVVSASGLAEGDEPAAVRARRTTSSLVRDALFSKGVRDAYGGLCAMCGINFSLIVGAHIYPVAAPEAPDKIWNGIALCHNHHAAFDEHRIHVDPSSMSVALHPELLGSASKSTACKQFIDGTFTVLAAPLDHAHRPRREMFEKRYDFFSAKYDWVT